MSKPIPKRCWRVMRIRDKGDDEHVVGDFGVLALLEVPDSPLVRFVFVQDGKDKDRLSIDVTEASERPQDKILAITGTDGVEHAFRLLKEILVDEGTTELRFNVVSASVRPGAVAK